MKVAEFFEKYPHEIVQCGDTNFNILKLYSEWETAHKGLVPEYSEVKESITQLLIDNYSFFVSDNLEGLKINCTGLFLDETDEYELMRYAYTYFIDFHRK